MDLKLLKKGKILALNKLFVFKIKYCIFVQNN